MSITLEFTHAVIEATLSLHFSAKLLIEVAIGFPLFMVKSYNVKSHEVGLDINCRLQVNW